MWRWQSWGIQESHYYGGNKEQHKAEEVVQTDCAAGTIEWDTGWMHTSSKLGEAGGQEAINESTLQAAAYP